VNEKNGVGFLLVGEGMASLTGGQGINRKGVWTPGKSAVDLKVECMVVSSCPFPSGN
jgi:hypothetical protein